MGWAAPVFPTAAKQQHSSNGSRHQISPYRHPAVDQVQDQDHRARAASATQPPSALGRPSTPFRYFPSRFTASSDGLIMNYFIRCWHRSAHCKWAAPRRRTRPVRHRLIPFRRLNEAPAPTWSTSKRKFKTCSSIGNIQKSKFIRT